MNRKEFLKHSFFLVASTLVLPSIFRNEKEAKEKQREEILGFNHIPYKKEDNMVTVIHKADSRGFANHGWLEARHSFSFANYYNPSRMNFGVLRVLNDDKIAPSMGFGTHPHDNMEIITIPLKGALKHKDSMGNGAVINHGDIQVMSAGSGVNHSEFNDRDDTDTELFQIWLYPNKKNVEPRYQQISIKDVSKKNELYQILSPYPDDQGVWIHQDAWFYLGEFDKDLSINYKLKNPSNGVYAMIIEGKANIEGHELNKRDAIGVKASNEIQINVTKGSYMLLMEVPLNNNTK
jgi:redox-sensitive bicupin YhaK (pirin superfamily)